MKSSRSKRRSNRSKAKVKGSGVAKLRNSQPGLLAPRPGPPTSLEVRATYEAGAVGRRLRLWQPGLIGANTAVLRDLNLLRNRSRDLVRNNPWISRGVNSW